MPPNLDHIDPGNAGGSVRIPELQKIRARPVSYQCLECERSFESLETLRLHRLDAHPIRRPYLRLEGFEQHLDHYVVTELLDAEAFHFIDTDRVSIDGADGVATEEAAELLSRQSSGRRSLSLTRSSYSVSYTIEFQIISEEVALAVEEAFIAKATGASPRGRGLLHFNDAVLKLDDSARSYAAALDRYVTGVMAKDREEGCQIPYEEFPELLSEANERLAVIRRPFAGAVRSVIGLIRNDFTSGADHGIPTLDATWRALCNGDFSGSATSSSEDSKLPIDTITNRIIAFVIGQDGYRKSECTALEALVSSPTISELDRQKLHLLLLAWHGRCGDFNAMNRHYAKVRHIRRVAGCADLIRTRYQENEHA
jgi:hypothetical protein